MGYGFLKSRYSYRRRFHRSGMRLRKRFGGRRLYRFSRFRRVARRRGSSQVFVGKVTWVEQPQSGQGVLIAPQASRFPAFESLRNLYEAYQFLRVRVKVTPTHNVADGAAGHDSNDPGGDSYHYISAPWHRFVTAKSLTELKDQDVLNLPRSREYHGEATSTRHFVPAIETMTQLPDRDGTVDSSVLKWKPRLEIVNNQHSFEIPQYCGLYYLGGPRKYQFTMTVWARFYNYKANSNIIS